jgi:TolB protein
MNVRIVAAAIFGASLLVPSSAVSAAGGYTSRVNLTDTGAQATEYRSEVAAMTPGARYIVFTSAAPNLADGDTNETWDVFLRDRQTASTTLISVSLTGTPADSSSYGNAVSADGRYVMVTSLASNLVPGDGGDNVFQVYVRDRWLRTTSRVSESGTGVPANGSTYGNAMSPDGRYLALASDATNLVPGDTNDATDVFIRDRARNTIDRVDVSTGGAEANAGSYEVAVSADGRYLAFTSDATNLVPGDTNGNSDVLVRDRRSRAITRASLSSIGVEGNDFSAGPALAPDGRFIAFDSIATNLVPGDTNAVGDVFLRRLA